MTQPVNYTSKFVSTDALNYKGREKKGQYFFLIYAIPLMILND